MPLKVKVGWRADLGDGRVFLKFVRACEHSEWIERSVTGGFAPSNSSFKTRF
jgi:hypothetical protein